MTPEKLKSLLLMGEGESIEFKANFNLDSVGKIICAFLNSGGGYVVCGVDDKNNIVGLKLNTDITELEKQIAENISPQALVSVEINNIEDKEVLLIEIPAGKEIPYSFKNDIFIRIGKKNAKADVETIKDMILRRQSEPERWERRFSDADLNKDLHFQLIKTIMKSDQFSRRYNFSNGVEGIDPLKDLGLIKYGRLTNAGDVLFTKNPEKRIPQVRVKAVCFNSDKTDDNYQDIKIIEGSLFESLEETYNFISRNISVKASFSKTKLERKEETIYPLKALREGLVNAFVHRDYSDFSGGLGVYIYPNRLEIWNSGELPEGITPENLSKGHISILRNPDIAHVVYLRGWMEKLGRGSLLIQKLCEEKGLPKPEWKSEKYHGVTLTFFAPQAIPQDTPQVTPQVEKLLLVLQGEMRRDELQEKLKLQDRKSFRELYINPALEAGLIEMTIPDKPSSPKQKYRLTKAGNNIRKIAGE